MKAIEREFGIVIAHTAGRPQFRHVGLIVGYLFHLGFMCDSSVARTTRYKECNPKLQKIGFLFNLVDI